MLREIIIVSIGLSTGSFLAILHIKISEVLADIKAECIFNKKKSDYLRKQKTLKGKANDFKSLQG